MQKVEFEWKWEVGLRLAWDSFFLLSGMELGPNLSDLVYIALPLEQVWTGRFGLLTGNGYALLNSGFFLQTSSLWVAASIHISDPSLFVVGHTNVWTDRLGPNLSDTVCIALPLEQVWTDSFGLLTRNGHAALYSAIFLQTSQLWVAGPMHISDPSLLFPPLVGHTKCEQVCQGA